VILCPTRELAAQTVRECKKLVKGRKYYIKLMTKELSKSGNFKDMHCDILVSTPLRLDHAVKKRDLDLSRYVSMTLNPLLFCFHWFWLSNVLMATSGRLFWFMFNCLNHG